MFILNFFTDVPKALIELVSLILFFPCFIIRFFSKF